MPRVADNLIDGVAFLYPSREDAEKHAKFGGTCLLVGHPVIVDNRRTGHYVPYVVSNRHVVWNGGAPVIRVNREDGSAPDIIEKECTDWVVHPGGDDVAATCVFGQILVGVHKFTQINTDKFITQEKIAQYEIGIGDEVLMMGRFVNHQGRTDNQPAMRFGSISVMPQPIRNSAIGKDQLSYAVEMRSRTGFSGSPVAVYRTPATILTKVKEVSFYGLLGVNWGYILDEDGENTWLNGVAPAWKILETLNTPKLQERHAQATELWKKMNSRPTASGGGVASSAISKTRAKRKKRTGSKTR